MTHSQNMLDAIESFTATHHGVTLDYSNLTPSGLAYLLDMGLKQSLTDVATVNRPKITGLTSKGAAYTEKGVWTAKNRLDESARLAIADYDDSDAESRKALADAWIAEAVAAKFARILAGELTVSASGTRGDALQREMVRLVGIQLLATIRAKNAKLGKAEQLPILSGKALTLAVQEKLVNPKVAEYFRPIAEANLAATDALDIDDLL